MAVEAMVARARSEVNRITKETNPFLAVIKRHEESLAANKSNYGVLKTELKNIQEQALLLIRLDRFTPLLGCVLIS